MTDLPFVEKYRPNSFSELIGISGEKVRSLIEDDSSIPNLLFLGSPGTGKTSAAMLVLDSLKPVDVLRLNGSDTTGVDTIRDKVFNFIISRSRYDGKPKIVWIEEFDYLSQNAFAALRSMIEEYSSNSRFICTANYKNNIPEPIHSRFTTVEFGNPTSEDIVLVLKRVCQVEGITANDDTLRVLADSCRGDFRRALNKLQLASSNETKTVNVFDVIKDDSLSKSVYELLLKQDWYTIRYDIPPRHPDYRQLISELETLFFESELPLEVKREIVVVLAQAQFELHFSFDNNITFSAMASKIISVLEKTTDI
jgi:replication factor C small subunit